MRRRRAAGLMVLGALLGCEGSPVVPGTAGDAPGVVEVGVQANLSAATRLAGVSVEVTGPGIPSPILANLALEGGVATGAVRVSAGGDRTFTIRGFSRGGIETHRGGATADVRAGTNPMLEVRLLPRHGEQPLRATLVAPLIRVRPDTLRLAPADSLRPRATATDPEGRPLPDAIWWATLDPGVATVDPSGLVTATGPGETRIVAVYAGTAAAVPVLVEALP